MNTAFAEKMLDEQNYPVKITGSGNYQIDFITATGWRFHLSHTDYFERLADPAKDEDVLKLLA